MDRKEFWARMCDPFKRPKLDPGRREALLKSAIVTDSLHIKCMVAMEECAELSQQLSKYGRGEGDYPGLLEEIADVCIMTTQIMMLVGISEEELSDAVDIKLFEMKERMGWS